MEINFKFNIGDTLKHVGASSPDEKFVVTSRIMDECPGNIQKFYLVRSLRLNAEGEYGIAYFDTGHGHVGMGLQRFHEEEMEAWFEEEHQTLQREMRQLRTKQLRNDIALLKESVLARKER